jgi:hypothetical protein
LAKVFDQPQFVRYQTVKARRLLSVAQIISVLSLGWIPLYVAERTGVWQLGNGIGVSGITLALLALTVYTTGLLNASIGGLTEIPARDLDEIQLRQRDRGYRWAYVASGIATLGFMIATFLFARGAISAWQLSMVGWATYCVAIGAPAHVLAWTIPPLEHDEG